MQINVTRALFYKGAAYAAGAIIDADAFAANGLISSGRAVLADPTDAARVQTAITEFSERQLRALNATNQQAAANWILERRA